MGILLCLVLLLGLGLAYQSDRVSELEKQTPIIKKDNSTTPEVQAAKKYRKVRYIKRYRYVKRYRNGKYRYVRAAYYIKVTVSYYKSSGKGTGDCWTNSEILYNSLKAKGYHVRIIQYPTSYSRRHSSVQYLKNGHWVNYNYKANGYAWRYYYTSNYVNGKVIKSC